jgi:hypothetical protein
VNSRHGEVNAESRGGQVQCDNGVYVAFSCSSGAPLTASQVPSLGLHYAAASGDVGLVGYALSHGQPVNSVVDGVLPLHAACAGGNSQVVKLLIDHGADVNAQR